MSGRESSAVVMGASAGALEALSEILPALPADYALPVMIVVHLPPDKDSILVQLLAARCALPVREAEDKMPIEPGTVYVAAPDYHLLVEKTGHLSLSSEEQVLYSRPSIDVLFETAADAYGEGLVGVVLSGANRDGAHGLQAVMEAGGMGIVQNPESAFAREMPRGALKACPTARVLALPEIGPFLASLTRREVH